MQYHVQITPKLNNKTKSYAIEPPQGKYRFFLAYVVSMIFICFSISCPFHQINQDGLIDIYRALACSAKGESERFTARGSLAYWLIII
jgi:hypothetical protein